MSRADRIVLKAFNELKKPSRKVNSFHDRSGKSNGGFCNGNAARSFFNPTEPCTLN